MRFRSPIQSFSISEDLRESLVWSSVFATPGVPTTVTFLLAILERGTGTKAYRVLRNAHVTNPELEPLEATSRPQQRPSAKGLGRLVIQLAPHPYSTDLDRALRRAAELSIMDRRRVVTIDDLFLSLLTEDCPGRQALESLGKDPTAMRSEMMRTKADY